MAVDYSRYVTGRKPTHNRTFRPKLMEVWIVDVPFDNGRGSKKRPAIVVRESDGRYGVVMMTSSDATSDRDFTLMDPESAGLEYGSTVKAGKVYDVAASRFYQKKGVLSDYDRDELALRMRQ